MVVVTPTEMRACRPSVVRTVTAVVPGATAVMVTVVPLTVAVATVGSALVAV